METVLGVKLDFWAALAAYVLITITVFKFVYVMFLLINVRTIVEKMVPRDAQNREEHVQMTASMFFVGLCLYSGYLIFDLTMSIFILIAISETNHVFLLPWLIFKGIMMILTCLTLICTICSIIAGSGLFTGNISVVIVNIITTAIYIFFWYVIFLLYGHYKKMKS